jgi:prephenate dehydrogenase
LSLAPEIRRHLERDCLVTDVASTKQVVTEKLAKIFPNYVGSHPLAGSEKRGIANAASGIFKDSLCILTPTKNTPPLALKKLMLFWRRLGCRTALLDPRAHDRILSFVSHLPHAVAFSLIASVPQDFLKFGASGLKDTTRIAASDSKLWADIFLSNKNLVQAIEEFQNNLSRIKGALKNSNRGLLTRILKQAKTKREILG